MNPRKPASTIRKTPNFDFLYGRYSHSKIRIPYFQVNMTFADAASYLKLVNEMPGASAMDWRIEELFQRDIDWGRVEKRIAPYLKQSEQPQFFNSITIALLPFRDGSLRTYDEGPWATPDLEEKTQFMGPNGEDEKRYKSFGPIRGGYWTGWSTPDETGALVGQLCWNTAELFGIAIDGQHRLAAIKYVAGGSTHAQCTVPVLLVVLDPDLGYTGETTRSGVIATLRRLFIDLNKHAIVPSRARQILLDDRDPASICVRSMVGQKLTAGAQELTATPPALPLSLIDWHSEQARFEKGPYLATVLGIDWAVAKLLNIKPMQDMMAHDSVHKLLSTLERRLDIQLATAYTQLDDCRRYERPFSFSDDELAAVASGFQEYWAPPLIHLLTELTPYRELIDQREKLTTLSPEFSNWFALKQRADDADSKSANDLLASFEKELAERQPNPIAVADFASAIDSIVGKKKARELAFTVVFQRALILAFKQFLTLSEAMLGYAYDDDDDEDLDDIVADDGDDDSDDEATALEFERATQLVDALNDLIDKEPDFLLKEWQFQWPKTKNYDRFWIGSLVQLEGPIDFTQAASGRASDLLLLVALLWLYLHKEGVESFAELVDRMDEAEGGLDLKMQQCINRLSSGEGSVAMRILRGTQRDEDEDAARREALGRAEWLWDVLNRK
ncbi:MAG: hypothetical protein KDB90_04590 [Planctomycetes bacterium]|nr:hypothetical protein [Planctomycetota bacterium]